MGFQKVGFPVGSGDGVGEIVGIADGNDGLMDDFAEPALVDAGNVPVDRHDAVEVDGFGFILILAQDFEFRVVDDQPAALLLYFSVGDDLMPGGDDFRHEGHVEPAAGDFPRAENPAGTIHDDGLVKTGFSETLGPGIDHAAGEADGFRGGLVGKTVELPAVLVSFREMR